MRAIIGCEFSQIVCREFRKHGHDAYSCDLLPTEGDSRYHLRCDLLDVIYDGWDIGIFFPSCRYLAVSGARWFKERIGEQVEAINFVKTLLRAPIPKIALENPIGVLSTTIRKPDQIIQPWQFGHGETKATCLWIKNLPLLTPTKIVEGREGRVWKEPPHPDRWKNRSRTYEGIAAAMAEQWG